MDLTFIISIYLVVWWTVLLAILPLGSKSYAEMGIEVTDGGDPGAPVNPNLKRKFFTTTWVSAIIVGLFWAAAKLHLLDFLLPSR
jgi:predicted secreted protein